MGFKQKQKRLTIASVMFFRGSKFLFYGVKPWPRLFPPDHVHVVNPNEPKMDNLWIIYGKPVL